MQSWAEFDLLVRGGSVGILLLMMAVLWRDHRHTKAGSIGIVFLVTVACHVIATVRLTGLNGMPSPSDWFFEIGSNAAPGMFWLFTRAWFNDERPGWRSWLIVAISVACMHVHAWILWYNIEPWIVPTGILGRVAAIGLAGLALYIAWKGRGEDLIEERRRLRTWGVGLIGLYTLIVLTVEIGMRPGFIITTSGSRSWLMIGIFLLTLAAARAILATNRADLFGAPQRAGDAEESQPEVDTALAAKLEAHMAEEFAWREDGLTIATLARRLDTQEYRLRRLINSQLGHRNFAAFLNSYRLEEVRNALADPEQRDVPILTIALDAGFGSLGPFNRAFRDAENMTPSQYRAAKIG